MKVVINHKIAMRFGSVNSSKNVIVYSRAWVLASPTGSVTGSDKFVAHGVLQIVSCIGRNRISLDVPQPNRREIP